MPFQEVVEAEGHLIDSHIMELIFDKVVEFHGRFEVEQFRIGRTNRNRRDCGCEWKAIPARRWTGSSSNSSTSAAPRSTAAMPNSPPSSATGALRKTFIQPPITGP